MEARNAHNDVIICKLGNQQSSSNIPASTTSASASNPFPQQALVGALGDLAIELSKGTEVPEEFIFAAALTCFGAIVSGELRLNIGMTSDTRLYTVLLGKSYAAKKSSAMSRTIEFFSKIKSPLPWTVDYGIGSAEGLAGKFGSQPRILLAFDELRSFIEKTKVQSSVLLPMVTSLFEGHSWDNATKGGSVSVRDARLSIVGCCTTDTYEDLWTGDAISIGMLNRLFVVDADAKPKVAWPIPPDEDKLEKIRQRIQLQLARLPMTYNITSDARGRWEEWYGNLPTSEHAKRLDTYPGVHVLYHRWQVKGRRETPAPFWITQSLDGQGASYYTFGDRKAEQLQSYFDHALKAFRSIAKIITQETIVVQMVAFAEPEWQLRRYSAMMNHAGFNELKFDELANNTDGRVWRSVPNRKWYASQLGTTPASKEVVLFHKLNSSNSSLKTDEPTSSD